MATYTINHKVNFICRRNAVVSVQCGFCRTLAYAVDTHKSASYMSTYKCVTHAKIAHSLACVARVFASFRFLEDDYSIVSALVCKYGNYFRDCSSRAVQNNGTHALFIWNSFVFMAGMVFNAKGLLSQRTIKIVWCIFMRYFQAYSKCKSAPTRTSCKSH